MIFMEGKIVTGSAGAPHLLDAPLTTTVTREVAPDLLLSDIDSRIVKIRPMATPIDQISRMAGARSSKSMITEYYSVDTPPTETTMAETRKIEEPDTPITVALTDGDIFSESDTVLVPDASDENGNKGLVLYVKSVSPNIVLVPIGKSAIGKVLEAGMRVIRMGRAAAEMDVQTTHAQALPVKKNNYCQIFKAQVEQSMLQRHSAKEVGWTLTDQQEVALIDMRMGMEKNFLFGRKFRFDKGASHGEVFMTEGIWHQTDHDFSYDRGALTPADLVKLSREAFTGNAGSSRKILIGGSGFIEALSSLETVKAVGAAETVTRWGIDFTEIHTKFGRLYVVLSEVFDACGHADDAMVIDPEYLQKYTHLPFKAMPIDLMKSGQRNSEAVVLTEASCLVLRYPGAHTRIVARNAPIQEAPETEPDTDEDDENSGGGE